MLVWGTRDKGCCVREKVFLGRGFLSVKYSVE